MRKLVSLVIVLSIIMLSAGQVLATPVSYKNTNIGVIIDGQWMKFTKQPVIKNDRILVPARATLQELGAKVDWYSSNKLVKVYKDSTVVDLEVGSKDIKVNNVNEKMDVEPIMINGLVMVPIRFVAQAVKSDVIWDSKYGVVRISSKDSNLSTSRGDERKEFKVVIDPGHGGCEPGAVYYGVKEKDLNLDIAKRLNALLKVQGIKTYMTREDDSYVDLYQRSAMANSLNADLFISIHNNAGDWGGTGSMTLYYPRGNTFGGNLNEQSLAYMIQSSLAGGLNTRDLGIIPRSDLAVLRTSYVPAILAEVGYMSDKNELAKLETENFRQQAAEALKNGVVSALSSMK